jgi:hypothetical protein
MLPGASAAASTLPRYGAAPLEVRMPRRSLRSASCSSLLLLTAAPLLAASLCAQQGVWVDRGATFAAACSGQLLGFDRARGRSVWFGRQGCLSTWLWNGAAWQQGPQLASPGTTGCAGAYDEARQVMVVVRGDQTSGLQTWEWNGVSWLQRGTGPSPARRGYAMAYDAARGVTVLFGGTSGNEDDSLGDTWTWNGTTWTRVMLGGPLPRSYAAMTYDVQRQTVLLFGGVGQLGGTGAFFGDTWEWNGTQWIAHFGIASPPARRATLCLAHDRLRNRTLLRGGSNGTGLLVDSWEWNGSAWTQLQPGSGPADGTGLVFDDARGVFVLVDSLFRTWEYAPGSAVAATFTPYGAGCAGPTGVPVLQAAVGSLPRIGSTLQLQLTNLPTSVLNVPLGFLGFDAASWNGVPLPLSLTPLGFPGCSALLAPVRTDALVNNNGTAAFPVVLPFTTFALGADVYFQGAVMVPGFNPGGFVFTNGGHAVVGSP